ncbi:MAG: hypothetical protein DDT35_01419 [Firmicutes bacterium]|nr:hypothetical protein [Bacillota bacterium]
MALGIDDCRREPKAAALGSLFQFIDRYISSNQCNSRLPAMQGNPAFLETKAKNLGVVLPQDSPRYSWLWGDKDGDVAWSAPLNLQCKVYLSGGPDLSNKSFS